MTSSDARGYWVAKSAEEYLSFRKQQMSRVLSIIESLNAMDGNLLGQEVMALVDM